MVQDSLRPSSSESNDDSEVADDMVARNVTGQKITGYFDVDNPPSPKSSKVGLGQRTKSAVSCNELETSSSNSASNDDNDNLQSLEIITSKENVGLGNSAQTSSDVYIPPSGVPHQKTTESQLSTNSNDDLLGGIFSKIYNCQEQEINI